MNRAKNVLVNITWGGINKILLLILPFVQRIFVIRILGITYLGLNSLFVSILGLLSLAELGIGSALVYSMYEPIAKGNPMKVCALLKLYRKYYYIIGIFILLIGFILLPFIPLFIKGAYPKDINIYIIYLIYLVNTALGYFLWVYKKSILIAYQRTDIDSNIASIAFLIQYLVQIIMLCLSKNFYIFSFILLLGTLINNILTKVVTDKLFPQYSCKGNLELLEIQKIKSNVLSIFFQKIGNVVLSFADYITISAFLGLNVLAVYDNYRSIIASLFGFFSVIMDALKPSVGNSLVLEKMDKNYNDFKKLNFLYMWISAWAAVCLICLFQPFMAIWMGKNMLFPYQIVIIFGIYFFIHKWMDMLYVYQESAGIWKKTKYIPLVAAIVNLILNIVLVNFFGVAGVILPTIISVLFVYNTGYAFVMFKYFFGKKYFIKFVLHQLFYFLMSFIGGGISLAICSLYQAEYWKEMLFNSLVCLIIPNLFWYIAYSKTNAFKETKIFVHNLLFQRKETT